MIDKATETASEVEQTAKEIAREVKETTFGAAETISLALTAGVAGAAGVTLLLIVAII